MKALVTGGGGFLGGAIVRALVKRGDTVRSFSRQRYHQLNQLGVEQHLGDLAKTDAVLKAASDVDIIFHVAAKAGVWGPHDEYYKTNVIGTRNVIAACRKHKIRKLVFTSSPSVVHTGFDLNGINESAPISTHFDASYPATKAESERDVLAAKDADLATVALRPHLIWGPGDNHLFPRLVQRVKKGQFRFIGDGSKLVDVTYIDNAVHAHLLAADRIQSVAGKAYFISDGAPVQMKAFINQLLSVADLPPVNKYLGQRPARVIANILESFHKLFRISAEPRLTRFLVSQFSSAHWFEISAARRDLGYEPIVSTQQGLEILKALYQTRSGGGPSPK